MAELKLHTINAGSTIADAMHQMNELGRDLTLFVLDQGKLIGSLTDGDIRRSLLKGKTLNEPVENIMNKNFKFIKNKGFTIDEIDRIKSKDIKILPVVDDEMKIVKIVNFSETKSVLPIDAVIMAGGDGIRLRPLTEKTPKPLLIVGNRPIIEHGINHLLKFGIENITISVNYLGEQIINYFGNGKDKNISISYVTENSKLGTIGSVSLIETFYHNDVLVMNSDLLTNIDLEEFYRDFVKKEAALSVACIPYTVNIPYAIVETDEERILSLKEKPNLTFHSNAGIYLVKKEFLNRIPRNKFFNATDLIESLISDKQKVTYYSVLDYWLDIGKMDDYKKAQEDIKHIRF